MIIEDCIKKLMKIDSLQIATVDKNGSPQIRVISARIFNNTTMYFLTAKGKSFVKEMENNRNIAIIGFDEKENDMIRITGIVEKVSQEEQLKWRNKIYETYPYLENVYPNETKNINIIYKIENYNMEYFTLSTHPITRQYFAIGNTKIKFKGFKIGNECINCGTCKTVCPQNVITEGTPFVIQQEHCLHCGNCFDNCPVNAIKEF